MSQTVLFLLLNALGQTVLMVVVASIVATIIGLPLGMALYVTKPTHILAQSTVHFLLSVTVNVLRSIPFVILMVLIIPFTRLLIGTSIGTLAAIVPLTLCAIPFVARVVEHALLKVDKGLIEAAIAMGASAYQIMRKILLPEALAGIIHGLTLAVITLIGYSAMAGAIGGGGLGDVAIRYGYERFDQKVMLLTVIIIIALVQVIQWSGERIVAKYLLHK